MFQKFGITASVALAAFIFMSIVVILTKFFGLWSSWLKQRGTWVIAVLFLGLLVYYGWDWFFFQEDALQAQRHTQEFFWRRLVTAFWSGVVGIVVGWLGWEIGKGRR